MSLASLNAALESTGVSKKKIFFKTQFLKVAHLWQGGLVKLTEGVYKCSPSSDPHVSIHIEQIMIL